MDNYNFTKGKWELSENGGLYVTSNPGMIFDLITSSQKDKYNALLISKAPEILEETQDTIDELKLLKSTIIEASKTNNKLESVAEVIQNWIDRKEQLIKEATEL